MLICGLEIWGQGLEVDAPRLASWASEPIRQPGNLFVLFFVVFVVELRGVTEP